MYKVVSVIYIINCFIFDVKCWKQNQRLKTPLYAVPLDICNIKFSELTMLIYWFRSFWPVLWVASIAGKSIFLSMDFVTSPPQFPLRRIFCIFQVSPICGILHGPNERAAGWLVGWFELADRHPGDFDCAATWTWVMRYVAATTTTTTVLLCCCAFVVGGLGRLLGHGHLQQCHSHATKLGLFRFRGLVCCSRTPGQAIQHTTNSTW